MKKFFLLGVLGLLAQPALAANAKDVSYKSGDETVHGLGYTPGGKGPFPGIIVIHDYWGLNDWVKEQAGSEAYSSDAALSVKLDHVKDGHHPHSALKDGEENRREHLSRRRPCLRKSEQQRRLPWQGRRRRME